MDLERRTIDFAFVVHALDHADPAVASGILVTSPTDCRGFLSFPGLAIRAPRHFHP